MKRNQERCERDTARNRDKKRLKVVKKEFAARKNLRKLEKINFATIFSPVLQEKTFIKKK